MHIMAGEEYGRIRSFLMSSWQTWLNSSLIPFFSLSLSLCRDLAVGEDGKKKIVSGLNFFFSHSCTQIYCSCRNEKPCCDENYEHRKKRNCVVHCLSSPFIPPTPCRHVSTKMETECNLISFFIIFFSLFFPSLPKYFCYCYYYVSFIFRRHEW